MALLRRGSRGDEVLRLQKALNKNGYKVDEDGIFGAGVEQAVKEYQKKQGLDVDGLVGPNTLKALEGSGGGGNDWGAPAFTLMKRGSRDGNVTLLQQKLNSLGYSVDVDGIFGGGVETAVKAFQRNNGLDVDGMVGKGTWNVLLSIKARKASAQPAKAAASAAPAGSGPGGKTLSEADFAAVAADLGVEIAAVKAVCEVESRGAGFLPNGDPKILFEGHIFWRYLKKAGINPEDYVQGNEDILYPKWSKGHYKGGEGEYERLGRAEKINKEVALMSASWGMFQIMGFNHSMCGYATAQAFVDSQYVSARNHLAAFGSFIKSARLLPHLKNLDWAAFAKGYNGPAYAENQYDKKLAAAYAKYS